MSISRKKLLAAVAVAGVLVKLAEFLVWRNSVFRWYNFIPGLDMETLLRFSEWGTKGNGFFLTPHRALIAAWWALKNHSHHVPGIVAVQSLFGIMGAVLCADLALKFCRRDRISSLACGLFYLLYGPFFIYEFSVLQEAVSLNLILLAFHAAVSARSRRSFVWAGVTLGLCVVGRPTALLFVPLMLGFMAYRELAARRRPWKSAAKKLLPAVAGIFAVLCLVSTANQVFGGNWNCFFNVVPYSLEFNAGPTGNAPEAGDPYLRMLSNAVRRAPRMFMPTEVPENLNYCFLCRKIPFLNALPGPGILLPLALAGMLLLIPKFRRPAALVLLPIAALVLPLCVREPIGRYRLTLIPYFILCAGYWLHVARKRPVRSNVTAVALAGLCFALLVPTYRSDLLRSDDYLACALAAEYPLGGKPTKESIALLAEGWERGSFRNNKLGINLYHRLEGKDALQVLVIGAKNSPEKDFYLHCLAFYLADAKDYKTAEQLLAQVSPEKLGNLAGDHHFLYAEMLRLRGEKAGAIKRYKLALNTLESNSEFARRSREQLAKLVSAPDAPGVSGTAPSSPAAPSRE